MKIQLLFLSDLHIKDEETLSDSKITDIVKALSIVDKFDNCIIVISGDIAFSGKESQYSLARRRLLKLKQAIETTFNLQKVKIVLVPGNHDNDYGDIAIDCDSIAKIKDKEFESRAQKDRLFNFFRFSKQFGCFNKNSFGEVQICNFNGYKIQFVLINSAIFSAFKDKNGKNEKGLHYMQRRAMENIEKYTQDADLSIFISHHSPEWFDEESKHLLEEYINRNISLAFWGHEHYNNSYKCGAHIFKGGVLCGEGSRSDFYSLLLDTDNNILIPYHAEYDFRKRWYIFNEEDIKEIENKQRIQPYKGFVEEHINVFDPNLRCRMSDVFVEPRIFCKNNSFELEEEFLCIDDVITEIENSSFCIITGDDLSGKSTFLRALYLKYCKKGYSPIFLTPETLCKTKIKKLIKYNFYEQYGEDEVLFQKYMSLPKEKRILMIDDIHMISNKGKGAYNNFLKLIENDFSKIIVSTNNEEFDVLNVVKTNYEAEGTLRFTLAPFYMDKRKELIGKVINLNDNKIFMEKEKYISLIDKSIQNQLRYFSLTPHFILLYTFSFMQNAFSVDGNTNVFNSVFQANITNLLRLIKNINIPRAIQILQQIAYFIHSKKIYPLPFSNLIKVIEEFNKEHAGGMRAQDFANAIEKIGFIKVLDNDTVVFTSKNYLAYFIALSLNGKLGTDEGNLQIKELLINLCFGINADILFFLSYLTNRTEIIDFILLESDNFLNEWVENNLDKKNLKCLFVDFNAPQMIYPSSNQKAERTKDIVKYEERVVKSNKIEVINIYDYNPDEINIYVNKQNKVLKLIEIISKILPNFEHMLSKEKMEKIVDKIYSIPNKLVYYMFKPFDDNFEDTVNDLVGYVNSHKSSNEQIDKPKAVLLLQDLMTAIILTLYDYASRLSATDETYELLMSPKYSDNLCNKIQQCLVLYQFNDFEKLGRMIESIYDNTKVESIKFMMIKIARNYLLNHNVPYVHYGQHFIDKFFPNKKIILERKKLKAS